MGFDEGQPFGQREGLGHCPHCASRLIYTVDAIGYELEVILARRCPECEHRESVVVSALSAARGYRRDTRILAGLLSLANALGEEASSAHVLDG
jgi:DNA-directed RNA polymerase subunit RPC12/RpoP